MNCWHATEWMNLQNIIVGVKDHMLYDSVFYGMSIK